MTIILDMLVAPGGRLPGTVTSNVADRFMRELTVQDQSLSRLLTAVQADRLTRRRLLAAGAALAGLRSAPVGSRRRSSHTGRQPR